VNEHVVMFICAIRKPAMCTSSKWSGWGCAWGSSSRTGRWAR